MGKIKGFVLNRKQYSKVRKMDHCQMTLWVESIYKRGYADGQKSVKGLNVSEIRKVLLGIKGIGEIRLKDILTAVERAMNEKEGGEG